MNYVNDILDESVETDWFERNNRPIKYKDSEFSQRMQHQINDANRNIALRKQRKLKEGLE
ncbi:hypothetical protein [Vibrio phage vB_VpaP_SJSY21]|nr:hypothetical protein [Vibrio phage vB_VpaP_SJSY21]